tara:strand:+ start:364 stop:531 length:168 start_codon:yes stop_codon:yes gene_type:complete
MNKDIKPNFYDGSDACAIENKDFFVSKLEQFLDKKNKMTPRQAINQIIKLLDIIN